MESKQFSSIDLLIDSKTDLVHIWGTTLKQLLNDDNDDEDMISNQ